MSESAYPDRSPACTHPVDFAVVLTTTLSGASAKRMGEGQIHVHGGDHGGSRAKWDLGAQATAPVRALSGAHVTAPG